MEADLAVQIVRYVDDHFPGWVESEFVDADGRCHTIRDKVLVFTADYARLGPDSDYPQPGQVRCEILSQSLRADDTRLVQIGVERPWAMESTEGLSEFVVLSTQLSVNPEETGGTSTSCN
jgi:hypothetical protein